MTAHISSSTVAVLLTCLFFSSPAHAESEENKQAVDRLLSAMMAEAAQFNKEHPDRATFLPTPQQMGIALHDEEADLSQTGLGYYHSEEVLKSFDDLKSIRAKYRASAVGRARAEVEALKARVRTTVASATEPAELDGILSDLLKMPENFGPRSYQDADWQQISQQISLTRQFTTQWQDYLALKKGRSSSQLEAAINNLISTGGQTDLVPRSRLLAMKEDLAAQSPQPRNPAEVVQEIKTLDDIPAAVAALQIARNYSNNGDVDNTISILSTLDRNYREFTSGLSISLELYTSWSEPRDRLVAAKAVELRALFMKRVLPRYIDAPDGVAPRENETAIAFLERVADEAKTADNAALAYRAREARRALARNSQTNAADVSGMTAYVAGQTQEAAGQYMLAVTSYQNALKSGSDLVPGKSIGMRLTTIQADHPEEYRQGMARFLGASADRAGSYNPPARSDQNPPKTSGVLIVPPAISEHPSPANPEKAAAPAKPTVEEPKAPKKADEK